MIEIIEGSLVFSFSDDATVSKYDEWSFYRNQFNAAFGGMKAVDLLYVAKRRTWLIEIKDYRTSRRTKTIDLGEEIALKIRDTLAGLCAAQCNANDEKEKTTAAAALKNQTLKIVLHLEQPLKHSKLFPRAIDPAKIKQKLKQLLKSVDPHPVVVDQMTLMPAMEWTVRNAKP